jgi:two-component system chemotaxis sensor kinase CheA
MSNDYLDMFIEESRENLDLLEVGLMRLENESPDVMLATVRELFRFAHNLKGMAATVAQEGITRLAHRMEDLLDIFRNGVAEPTSEAVDELLRGTDAIGAMLDEVPGGATPAAPDDLLAALEERINQLNGPAAVDEVPAADPQPAAMADIPAMPVDGLTEGAGRFVITLADGAAQPGARSAVILKAIENTGKILVVRPDREQVLAGRAASFEVDAVVPDVEALADKLRAFTDVGSVVSTRGGAVEPTPAPQTERVASPSGVSVEGLPPGAGRFAISLVEGAALPGARSAVVLKAIENTGKILVVRPDREQVLAGKAASFEVDAEVPDVEGLAGRLLSLTDVASVEAAQAAADQPSSTAGVARAPTVASPGAQGRQTVRVEVERLDDLMNLVGELVIGRGQLEQQMRALGDRALGDVVTSLSRTISDLQAAVARARMITLEGTFSRMQRLVRDTSRDLGKDIAFTMTGGETELDRSMIDKVADPLVHLLRNALDHGIESADLRRATAKPPKGAIDLSARTEGNQVIITIADDGNGIDTDRVTEKAIAKGIITPDLAAVMDEADKQNLIFLPGFSTKESASAVSGRGVGMDVVRSSVSELGGTVDVESQRGVGSTFRIRLPLSLAVLDVLLVSISNQVWAIPLQHVEETINVEPHDVGGVLGSPVVTLRGETIGIIHGRRVIGHDVPAAPPYQAVVFRHRSDRWALSVDNLLEQAEVVVKPSPDEVGDVPHVAGATILGDGRVSMILDLSAIVTNLTRGDLRHAS